MPCHVMPCRVLPCRVMSWSCRAMLCRVMSCRVVLCHVVSFHAVSSRVVPFHLLPPHPFHSICCHPTHLYSTCCQPMTGGEVNWETRKRWSLGTLFTKLKGWGGESAQHVERHPPRALPEASALMSAAEKVIEKIGARESLGGEKKEER